MLEETCCSWPRCARERLSCWCNLLLLLQNSVFARLLTLAAPLVVLQDNPSAAYGAWMKLHGKEEVRCQGVRRQVSRCRGQTQQAPAGARGRWQACKQACQ